MNAMDNYADQFRVFLGLLPGAESLDDPNVLAISAQIKRADYLLFQRSMIAEVKQLETDPAYKVEAVLERYRSHPSYPLFFGQRTLSDVLAHMPQDIQDEIRQGVYDSISRSIMEGCEDANRQIRQTRSHFGLAHASGVLFILNDRIEILSPNVLGARIQQQMNKRAADGTDRFPEIAFVCALSWAHFIRGVDGTPSHPILTVEGPAAQSFPVASEQLDYIVQAWSFHSNSRLMDGGKASRVLLEDYRSALPAQSPTQVTRQLAWRQSYRRQRYLAALDVDELMKHGRRVFAELRPHFLIGEARQGEVREILQRWTDFMEECELRNLDMRQFRPISS
jgi:hypothetical protein